MACRIQFLLLGVAVFFMSIASYNAFPSDLDVLLDEAQSDLVARRAGIESIKAEGFNKNVVSGNESGNFAVANATNVLAVGFSENNAKGDLSGNFKVATHTWMSDDEWYKETTGVISAKLVRKENVINSYLSLQPGVGDSEDY